MMQLFTDIGSEAAIVFVTVSGFVEKIGKLSVYVTFIIRLHLLDHVVIICLRPREVHSSKPVLQIGAVLHTQCIDFSRAEANTASSPALRRRRLLYENITITTITAITFTRAISRFTCKSIAEILQTARCCLFQFIFRSFFTKKTSAETTGNTLERIDFGILQVWCLSGGRGVG